MKKFVSNLFRHGKRFLAIIILTIALFSNRAHAQTSSTPLPGEATDRLAIRELIDAYAHDADRRETAKQVALFTPDAVLENIHTEPGREKETTILRGREALSAGFAMLKNFEVTMHFNGQSTIEIHGDTATGETYCLAHHIYTENRKRMLMIIAIRYNDTIVRQKGNWLFAKRQLNYDWVDRRPLKP